MSEAARRDVGFGVTIDLVANDFAGSTLPLKPDIQSSEAIFGYGPQAEGLGLSILLQRDFDVPSLQLCGAKRLAYFAL